MEMEASQTQGENRQLVATSIYDAVKFAFFQHYCSALSVYNECLNRRGKGADDRLESAFTAAVIMLYVDARPKLAKTGLSTRWHELSALRSTAINRMTFEETEELFFVLRDFWEENGITKYEFAKHSPEEYTLMGMVRK